MDEQRAADGLTPAQVAEVLRRAAELDADDAAPADIPDLVAPAIVEEAAVEAGLSRAAVRRALVEASVGGPIARTGTRGGGPSLARVDELTAVRVVPGPPDVVRSMVERSLHREVFVQQRIFEDGSRWTPRRGVYGTLRRNVDPGRKRGLKARQVDVRVAPDPTSDGDRAVVRLDLDVRNVRRREAARAVGGTGVGVVVAGALVGANGLEAAVFAVPLGGGVAATGILGGRLLAQRTRERIDVAVNRLLDRIEHRGSDPRRSLLAATERAAVRAEERVARHLDRSARRGTSSSRSSWSTRGDASSAGPGTGPPAD